MDSNCNFRLKLKIMFNSLMPNTLLANAHHQTMTLALPSTHSSSNHTAPVNGFKMLFELESNTTLNKTLINLLKNSYFIKKSINWQPVKYELIVNNKLMQEFEQIKTEFKSEAKEECEYEEHYAFLIENDHQITEIVQNGYQCQESNYNVIGQSKSGVYLCKYPDVALRYNELHRYPDHFSLKMVIFKIYYGKQTLALVRKDAKLAPIPATLNFNSHMSVIAPKENDNIETQFDHSQIFLYEYDSNKIAAKRPRHCLPYAVVTWLRTDEANEWPVNFNDLEIIPQNSETTNGQTKEENNQESLVKSEENNELEQTSDETKENIDSEKKEETNNQDNKSSQNESEDQLEKIKNEHENLNAEFKEESEKNIEQDLSKEVVNQNETTRPNSNQALAQSATPNGTPVAPTTPNETTKVAANAYPKPSAYTAYRHAIPTTLNPFVYQPTTMGLRIPYAANQIPQAIGGLGAQSFLNQTIQSPLQQQVFLCRGPNGLTYVTAAPGLVQQQMAAAQQAQAQAVFQHQLLQAQQQAALFQKIPSNQAIINGQIYQNSQPSHSIQQVQQTPQIIYQAAPQPASQKPAQSVQQNSNVSQPQVQQAPQTQSPKSTNAQNQINGQATLLGYNAQPGQQVYAPSPSAQAAIATQQGYMLAGASIQNQNQQLQQLQQLQQQQQLLNYQLAAGNLGLNGFPNQAAGQAGLQSGQNIASLPVGYQLVDYRQLQGLSGTVSLDQLAGIQRSRLLQARHHPYQRP